MAPHRKLSCFASRSLSKIAQMIAGIGIIGGSGVHAFEGLQEVGEIEVNTPFGKPSSAIVHGRVGERDVYFLLRHGKGHFIAPHEINHRANIYAMRMLGVRWIVSIGAVGSLREEYQPQSIVVPDQLFDRTSCPERKTFFGEGIVAHVSFGDPYSAGLRALLVEVCQEQGKGVHDGGTYVSIDGPTYSTRAESRYYRQLGFDIIGMTNAPEAKLAREAEIAFAMMGFVTDYDSWRSREPAVDTAKIGKQLVDATRVAQEVVKGIIPKIPLGPNWPEHYALDGALVTPKKLWPAETMERLAKILQRKEA